MDFTALLPGYCRSNSFTIFVIVISLVTCAKIILFKPHITRIGDGLQPRSEELMPGWKLDTRFWSFVSGYQRVWHISLSTQEILEKLDGCANQEDVFWNFQNGPLFSTRGRESDYLWRPGSFRWWRRPLWGRFCCTNKGWYGDQGLTSPVRAGWSLSGCVCKWLRLGCRPVVHTSRGHSRPWPMATRESFGWTKMFFNIFSNSWFWVCICDQNGVWSIQGL